MILEPNIRTGRIHLVPAPLDYDAGFRSEIMAITEGSVDNVELGPIDKELYKALSLDEMMRAVKRLPPADLKAYIKQHVPQEPGQLTDAAIDEVVTIWKRELEEDPLSLLDPLPLSKEGAEFKMLKGFARETGLYMATLTGSFVYTDSDTQWARLHEPDGVHLYEMKPAAEQAVRCLDSLRINVPTGTYHHDVEPPDADATRAFLRQITLALKASVELDLDLRRTAAEAHSSEEDGNFVYKLRSSVPLDGFQRTDVSRLVLTFGRSDNVLPVQLALFLEPVAQNSSISEA